MDENEKRLRQADALTQRQSAALSAQGGARQTAQAAGNYDALADQARTAARNNKLQNPDLSGMQDTLDQWRDTSVQQANNQIDYATRQGVQDLARARDDAYQDYQRQVRQTYVDEAKARDNQALYAAARGDRGGIGAAQYDAIAANAATNRQTVYQAQTKLASDVARQIADLRAQGEYQKADKALEIAQQHLSQLFQMQQFAIQTGIDVAKFNASVDQWLVGTLNDLNAQGIAYDQWKETMAFQRERAERADYESDRGYERSVFESNRAFDYQKARDAADDAFREKQLDVQMDQFEKSLKLDYDKLDFTKEQFKESVKQWWTQFNAQMDQQAVDNDYRERALEQSASQFAQSLGLDKEKFVESVKQWWTQYYSSEDQRAIDNARNERAQNFNEQATLTQLGQNDRKIALDEWSTRATIDQNQQKIDQTQQQINNAAAQNTLATNQANAYELLNRGIIPNDTLLASIGISRETALAYRESLNQVGATTTNGTSGKSMTVSDAKNLAKSGVWTDVTYNAFLSNGWTETEIQAAYGSQDGYKQYMAGRNTGTASGGSADGTSAAGAGRTTSWTNAQEIQAVAESIWNGRSPATKNLTPEQRKTKVMEYLDTQGRDKLSDQELLNILYRIGVIGGS